MGRTFSPLPSEPANTQDKPLSSWRIAGRRVRRVLLHLIFWPVLLVSLVAVLIYVPPVQDFLRGKVVNFLKEKTGTEVQLSHLALRFPIGLSLEGLYVEDQQGDTLLYAGTVKSRAGLAALFDQRIVLGGVELTDVRATIHQTADSTFNFNFILDGFASNDTTNAPADTTGGWEFAIEDVFLRNVVLDLQLQPSSLGMALRLGELYVDMDVFQLHPKRFYADHIALRNTRVDMRTASGPPEPDTYPALVNPLADIDIRFNELSLENVAFTQKTTNTGDSLWLAARSITATTDSMDLTRQRSALNQLMLNDIRFGMLTADTATPAKTHHAAPPWLGQNDGFRYFLRDWNVTANSIKVMDSDIALHSGSIALPKSLFDPNHIVLNSVDLDLKNVQLDNAHVLATLDALNVTSGPDHTRLQASLALNATPSATIIQQGVIAAGGNTIEFDARAEQSSMDAVYRNPERIPLNIHASSVIDPEKLQPLLNALGVVLPAKLTMQETLASTVHAAGTLESLDTLVLAVKGDQGSVAQIRGRIANATAWPRTAFNVDVDQLTMGTGLREMVRAFAPPGTVLPQRLTLKAHGGGNGSAMQARIDMDSDLGAAKGTITASGWNKDLPDAFAVDLTVDRFQIARFTGDTAIGPVSVLITGKGAHMNGPQREANLSVTPKVLQYQGRDLSSVQLTANALGDSIHLDLKADAGPMKVALTAHGPWPIGKDSLSARFDLFVDRLYLEEMHLLEYPLNVEGQLTGNASFSRDMHGHFSIDAPGLRLFNTERDITLEQFTASGYLGTDSTAIDLDSDALTLNYHTNIAVDSLIPRSQAKILSFFSADTSFTPAPGKHMDLAITLPRPELLTGLVFPDLQAIRLGTFTGSYSSDTDELQLDLDLPLLVYDSITIVDLRTAIDAKGTRLTGHVEMERIERDSLLVHGLSIDAATAAGALTTTLRIADDEKDRYRIGTVLRSQEGVRTLHVAEDLLLNERTWTADPKNLIRMATTGTEAEHFTLSSGTEQIQLISEPSHLRIALTAFDMSTITSVVTSLDSIPVAQGTLDGEVLLPTAEGGLLSADLIISDLHALGTELGTLHMTARQPRPDTYHAEAELKQTSNRFNANADIVTGTNTSVEAQADIDFKDLSFLKPFVSSYLYALTGGLAGTIHYQQKGDALDLDGTLTFANAGVGVIQTGATYLLPKESMTLHNGTIHFTEFDLLDSLGNTFKLDGDVVLTEPSNPGLDLRLRTDKFQMINSTSKQNDMFYGDLFASTDLRITGTAIKPVLKGDLGILPGTMFSVVLPGSKVQLVGAEGIVVFTDDLSLQDTLLANSDGQMLLDSLQAHLPGIELDLSIHIDKKAKFAVVLDPTTGDQATFSGYGDLVFRYKPDGSMYLSGPFTLESGGYTLEFYGLVKKRFDLVSGSTIRWTGDPLKAAMNIKAKYLSESAPYPLVASTGVIPESERNRLQQPLPFEVVISVSGAVNDPTIDFGLDLDRNYRNSYPQVNAQLEHLSQPANVEDRNRQVFGLLVMNSFIQDEASGGAPSSGIATSAARNSVNGLLTDQMNKLTGKYIKGVNVSLGVNTYDQASGNQTYQRTSVDYKVSKRLLNDRLSFEVGGSVGVDEQNSQVSNVSNTRAAQYAILYDLTKDGRLRIRGFHENAFDLYDGDITNSGVALMFTRDFEENDRARASGRAAAEEQRKAAEQLKAKEEKE